MDTPLILDRLPHVAEALVPMLANALQLLGTDAPPMGEAKVSITLRPTDHNTEGVVFSLAVGVPEDAGDEDAAEDGPPPAKVRRSDPLWTAIFHYLPQQMDGEDLPYSRRAAMADAAWRAARGL